MSFRFKTYYGKKLKKLKNFLLQTSLEENFELKWLRRKKSFTYIKFHILLEDYLKYQVCSFLDTYLLTKLLV